MQSTEKVCEHQNANYLAMMRERDDALAALAAERDMANRAEARLAQILEYAESTYTASTVARRIVQMGKATA